MPSPQHLLEIVKPPPAGADATRWVEQHQLKAWLDRERLADRVTLYGSAYDRGSVFVHSILVPLEHIDFSDVAAFTSWSGNPFDLPSCGLVTGGGLPPRVELSTGLTDFSRFRDAKRLIYGRTFEARHGYKTYYELDHELTFAHGLHWMEERDAWCRLNDEGDVVDIARVERTGPEGLARGSAVAVTMDRQVLELHMSATGTCLVQMFDSTCASENFHGWKTWDDGKFANRDVGVILKYRVEPPTASFFRGVQVIPPRLTNEDMGLELYAAENGQKQYAVFITQDFKNRRVVDVSCSPDAIASYFQKESDLPFETSPVFFKPEVLEKYKADPDKYRLSDRDISCRNAWHLTTFDVNEAGQVHTYIKYLGDLPYSEQLYWKSFNEPPKAPISRRAFKTDFQGEFDTEPDGLRTLRRILDQLRDANASWFSLKEPTLLDQLHYPLTNSTKAWGDVLTTLAKCVVESINKPAVVASAKRRGAAGDAAWGSIKWLRELLRVLQVDDDRREEIVAPLTTLQMLRTKLDAHAGGNEAAALRRELLKRFQSPRGHIHQLATQLTTSLDGIDSILRTVAADTANSAQGGAGSMR